MRRALLVLLAIAGAVVLWRARLTDRTQREPHAAGRDGGLVQVDRDAPPGPDEIDLGPADRIELHALPATWYLEAIDADASDLDFGERVVAVSAGSAAYDAHLARAAREYAVQAAVLGESPPESVVTFLLHSAGAPDGHVGQLSLSTTSERGDAVDRAIRQALANAPPGTGQLLVGVGEASTPGDDYTRMLVVLVARRSFALEATPRVSPPNSLWRARGTLPSGYRDLSAWVLAPDLSLFEGEVEQDGDRFAVEVPTGDREGTMFVSLEGTGPAGPGKIWQLSVEVGRQPARTFEFALMPAETFDDIGAAESYLVELVNRDRVRLSVEPLASDPALADIARAHSREMRDRDFFGHLSPTTGLAGDRVRAAEYRARRVGENLALNDSLTEAQASLMASVGHRANLLDGRFTHVGVGVVGAERDGRNSWYVTQLFATPADPIDPIAVERAIVEQLVDRRSREGLPPLSEDADLVVLARDAAPLVARGDPEAATRAVGHAARHRPLGTLSVSAQSLYELEQLELPASVAEATYRTVGLGVAQDPDDLGGRFGVVVVLGQ